MTAEQFNFVGAWASIISLLISSVSLLLIRGIRSRIIGLRYRQRQQAIIQEILPLSARTNVEPALQRYKLDALERHLPSYTWPFTAKARTLMAVRRHLANGDLLALKEALADWQCFTEDL